MPRLGTSQSSLYPLTGCVRWYIEYWRSRAQSKLDPSKQEGNTLKNELIKAKLAEQYGHLISRVEVVQVLTAGVMRLGAWMDGFSASIGRELNWSAETIKLHRERLDEARGDFVKDIAEFLDLQQLTPPAKNDARSKKSS